MVKLISANLLILLFIFSCSPIESIDNNNGDVNVHEHKESSYYTCSMHPQIKEHEPGKCPICHMNLTKVEVDQSDLTDVGAQLSKDNEKSIWKCKNFPDVTSEKEDLCPLDGTPMVEIKPAASAIANVRLRKSQIAHFSHELFPVTTMQMKKEIRLLGVVRPSEESVSSVSARVGGRVEKVYVNSTGALIRKGDPVVDLYSPELITAGEEYLVARASYEKNKKSSFHDLVKESEKRLELWGIKKSQFEKWFIEKKVPQNITIYSEVTGVVQKRKANLGKYFKPGDDFFELSNLSNVWVEMDVYEHDAGLVDLRQSVVLSFTALPGKNVQGEIDFIEPVLDLNSRTLKVRTTIPNEAAKLKPGMVADATLSIIFEGERLVVPRSAVIDTGKRKVVWKQITDRLFQAFEVITGIESAGYIEIKDGIKEGDKVVMEGNFLLDAQAQLFGGYVDFGSGVHIEHNH